MSIARCREFEALIVNPSLVEQVRIDREVLETIGEWMSDLLICNIAVPELDGYALIREIRQRHDAGFNDHIAKPIDPAFFVASVAELIARSSLHRSVTT